ncbi:hypothetical protein [Chryseobacterium sp.]|mgnify:CR=1 FL=1|uniref:hypothetical protein n=1 Tax=Chryseobacterium sp. TaxID=1871047 RepID=UPI0025BE86F4|nr:hypothetical protein [Chryseobacterium sp.]
MLRKIIHLVFLPCSEATLLMEKRKAETISSMEDWKLSLHLQICKWCRAYEKKLNILDEILRNTFIKESKNEINSSDIQEFKGKLVKKLDI